ncbi:VOC family protein [Nocardia sp. NPDC052566]|uniref:VOC family protein n=1 Tax=Nocardia sp. NPDC052566 TaxID=3364330 RepID=UPI0037C73BFF
MASLTKADVVAFVSSTDLERSRRFFDEVLGLSIVEMTPFACVARGGNATIRITAVERFVPQPFTVLGWTVDDIADTIAELTGLGVRFLRYDGMDQSIDGVWTSPSGAKIAWFPDPDGNVLSLTEFVR